MPLVFLPDSSASPYSPYSHPYCQRQQQQPTFVGYPQQHYQQPSSFSPFDFADELDIAPSSLFSPAPPRHVHPQHQPSPASHYHPHQSLPLPFDPIEAQKQRLLAEFAQSLDKLYPSSSPSASRASTHPRAAAPSYDSERIRYLETQIREERLREELEQERLRLEEERERQEEEQRRRVAEQKRQQQLLQARLLQQQQRQHEEEQAARRRAEAQQQQQQQRRLLSPTPCPAIGGLEQLLSLLGVTEPIRGESQQPQQIPVQQPQSHNGIDKLLALAQALEDRPVPRAEEPLVAPEKVSRPPTPPTPSSPKPLPPSPLTTLRSLRSRFQAHLASSSTTPSNILSHHLEKLLIEADALESGGDQLVRSERKRFVRDVERVLEGLEEKPGAPADAEVKPAEAVEGSAPAEQVATPSTTELSSPLAAQDAPESTVKPSSSLDTPAAPELVAAETTAPSGPPSEPVATPLDVSPNDSSSDTSSTPSDAEEPPTPNLASSPADAGPTKLKRKGKPASVEDWDEEEEKERYEFVQ